MFKRKLGSSTSAILTMVLIAMLGIGCANSGGGGSSGEPAAAAAAKPAEVPPPAGSKLAKVTAGMTDEEVRKVMGPPDHTNFYMTGKAWIPWNFGAGDKTRSDWMYTGQGRVVFTQNQWNGRLSVIKVLYNPNELK